MNQRDLLNFEEYEEITKYIHEMLGAQNGVNIRGFGRNCWITGKSGVKHQVDVLTERFDGMQYHLTAIECKYLKKKVTKGTVMKLHGIMEDADIEFGIIVCRSGFTKDTVTYAEHKGIRLVELSKLGELEKRVEKKINFGQLDLDIKSKVIRPIIKKVNIGSVLLVDQDEIASMYYAKMLNAEGKEVYFKTCLFAFCNDLKTEGVLFKNKTKIYTPAGGILTWKYKGIEVVIERVIITGFLTEMNSCSKQSFDLVDEVWLVMNEIFEKRKFALSKSGMMYNLAPDR